LEAQFDPSILYSLPNLSFPLHLPGHNIRVV
jgi:hypothetical protein